jgi:hypothetical protein
MKTNLCILMMILLLRCVVYGQVNENVISVTVPYQKWLEQPQMEMLETTALEIVVNAGYISANKPMANTMKTSFFIEDESFVQGDKKSLVVIDARLALTLNNVESGHVFATVSKRYRGTGRDRKTAINSAISSIPTSDKDFGRFLAEGQRTIVAYYEKNASLIFAKATAKAEQNEYQAAIALLMSVPEKASCYKKALEQASEYYQQYLNVGCQEIIRKAKVYCAGQQYSQALEELAYPDIVWTTECAKEENKLIAQIAAQVSKQEIEKYEREKEERKIQREEYRFNAMMKLTDEYFSKLATIDDQE